MKLSEAEKTTHDGGSVILASAKHAYVILCWVIHLEIEFDQMKNYFSSEQENLN